MLILIEIFNLYFTHNQLIHRTNTIRTNIRNINNRTSDNYKAIFKIINISYVVLHFAISQDEALSRHYTTLYIFKNFNTHEVNIVAQHSKNYNFQEINIYIIIIY